jgi:cysteine desulfurase/selenocysteine lyase
MGLSHGCVASWLSLCSYYILNALSILAEFALSNHMTFDAEHYRLEFPIVKSTAYLNHAAVAPIARRVLGAMTGLLEDVQRSGARNFHRWIENVEAIRIRAANFISADPEEIAFVPNTSTAVSLFANALDWNEGDEVVSNEGEFPANYYGWKALERKGVQLRLVPQPAGEICLNSIVDAFTSRTRLMAVSFVQFLSGYRLHLNELGELCAARGVLLFVDAIQGLGAFPLDVRKAKIAGLAASGHKWLLGAGGCAILYVRRDLAEQMQPSVVGWLSVEGWQDFVSSEPVWRKAAERFECGTPNLAGIYGLGAALELLTEAGPQAISERILQLTGGLRDGLTRLGYHIYGPTSRNACSGIVTFSPRERNGADALFQRFEQEGIAVSLRSGMIRVSPHFYNTEAEIDRVLEVLRSADR